MDRGWFFCCVYLVHMKYIHPDIVVGEPVPEVQPRVDEELLRLMKRSIRWSRVCLVCAIVLFVVFAIFRPGWGVRIPVGGLFLVIWLVPLRRLGKYWKVKKKEPGFEVSHAPMNWSLPIWANIECTAYAASFGLVFQGFMSAGDGFTSIFVFLGMMMFIGGICFSMLSRFAREPGQVCCVDCEYPLAGLTIPCGCPECGRMVYDASWTTDHPRVRSGWFVPVGVAAAVLGTLLLVGGGLWPLYGYGFLPRGALTKLAMTDSRAFNRLVAQPMSSEETNAMIEALIARNEGVDGWGVDMTMQGLWLDQFLGTGVISQGQYDRILDRGVELIHFEGTATARVGELVRVELASERVEYPGVKFKPWYFSRGFEVVGVSGFEDALTRAGFIDKLYRDWPAEYGANFANPSFEYTPMESGELVIRVRIVLAVFPLVRHTKMNIDWSLDEASMFETQPIWYWVIDLEHEIEVLP